MKPKLVVVSHVLPFPRNAGQNQRVHYTLLAARQVFHVTFLTASPADQQEAVRQRLLELCDDAIVLPSRYHTGPFRRLWHRTAGSGFAMLRGLKLSNYVVGVLEFGPRRIEAALDGHSFDVALFEYWHACDATSPFRKRGIPTVLDMHDILWRSYDRQWAGRKIAPAGLKKRFVSSYRAQEESAWRRFDALVAINREELEYVRERVGGNARLFFAPMGTDLDRWPYGPRPAYPLRVAYYGGLASARNREGALQCANSIMPLIWTRHPEAEFWIVGSNPPPSLKALEADPRVKVTGTLEDPAEVLRTMACVLCPWEGAFGFRSRLIEVMSLGVPVVASPDAAAGMDLEAGQGIAYGVTPQDLAAEALRLMEDASFREAQGRAARAQVERKYSLQNTYARLMLDLQEWLASRKESRA
ncbi:MAG: glycosyltransferase family 4 protein [Chthonomonadales bacterium]